MPANARFVQEGKAVDYTPNAEVPGGDVVVAGNLVGVAPRRIPANVAGALTIEGVFEFAKATGNGTAIAFGAEVFWDAANSRADDDPAVGKRLGVCVASAGDSASDVRVKLDPAATGQEPATTTAYGVVKQAAPDADLTDSSGGTPSGTLAAMTNVAVLTDNTAGTANTTLQAVTDPNDTPATADVLRDDLVANALPAVRNNFADFAAQHAVQRTLNTALINAVASLATEINDLRAKLRTAGILAT